MIRHLLAYGNSDQASFRDEQVRETFDYMTVPGTIASYYADATAAFVLTSDLAYLIDPRTPLFQELIDSPRASHYSLADWIAIDLEEEVVESAGRKIARFPAGFYDQDQLGNTVERLLQVQFDYGHRSAALQEKVDRYRGLLAEALGQEVDDGVDQVKAPHYVLAPYFMSSSPEDEWWSVNRRIWELCLAHPRSADVSPVVAVTDVAFLSAATAETPNGLSDTRFLWVNGFEERQVAQDELLRFAQAVDSFSGDRRWINMYGGFFSIALATAGLWGFNNGLGYSEARFWPQLEATGGAPQRYYIPRLHTYVSVANAHLLFDVEPWFFEPVIEERDNDTPIAALSYHELKKDFALARRWEVEGSSEMSADDIAAMLDEANDRYQSITSGPRIPARLQIDTTYLERWRDVLRSM